MKKIVLSIILSGVLFTGCKKEEEPVSKIDNIINFKDANFKAVLVADSSINTNYDSEISESEASSFTGTIYAQKKSIQDVSGIEFFTNVTRIALFGNQLTTIDVSKNTKVTQLLIESNNLTSIDISSLTMLVDFKCHSNKLTKANIANGNNSNMKRMNLQKNKNLTCIKVDKLPVPTSGWAKDTTSSYNTDCN